MHRTTLAVFIPHVPRYLGLAFLSIALVYLTLSPSSFATPENADQARLKQGYNPIKSEAALFNAYMGQLERVDATDVCNEAAVSPHFGAPVGAQTTRRKSCTGICT